MSLLVHLVIFPRLRKVPEGSRGQGTGFDETEKCDGRVKGLMKQRSVMAG